MKIIVNELITYLSRKEIMPKMKRQIALPLHRDVIFFFFLFQMVPSEPFKAFST